MIAMTPSLANTSLMRFTAPTQPAAAPASAPAAACSTADQAQISNLRQRAAVCRHNGAIVGIGCGTIATLVGLSGSITGAVVCGGIGLIGLVANISTAHQLERQAAELQQRCGQPQP